MTHAPAHPAAAAPHVHGGLPLIVIPPAMFDRLVRVAAEVAGAHPKLVLRNDLRPRSCARARGLITLALREAGLKWTHIAALFGRSTHSALAQTSAKIKREIQQKTPWITGPNRCIDAARAMDQVRDALRREVTHA